MSGDPQQEVSLYGGNCKKIWRLTLVH